MRDELTRVLRSDLPGDINNAPVLCAHGRLDPGRSALVKRLSAAAYARLHSVHGGGPELIGGAAVCRDCASAAADAAAVVADADERRATAARTVAALERAGWPESGRAGPTAPTEPCFWVSRPWLLKWLAHVQRAPGAAGGAQAGIGAHFAPAAPTAALTAGPTAAIVCPHGALAPETAGKRASVPQSVWRVLGPDAERIYRESQAREAARLAARAAKGGGAKATDAPEVVDLSDSPQRKAGDSPGGDAPSENGATATVANDGGDVPMRDADDVDAANAASRDGPSVLPLRVGEIAECADCLNKRINERDVLGAQRNQCPLMLKGAPAPVEPGSQLRLLPAPWVAAWRAYHAGGRAQAPAPPGCLADAIKQLIPRCAAHGRLLARLPALARRGSKWQAREAPGAEPSAASVAADGGASDRCGAVPLSLVLDTEYRSVCLFYNREGECDCAPHVTVEAPAVEGGPPALVCNPPPCEDCLAQREADERERAARFINADIMVEVKHAPRDAPPPDAAAAEAAGGDITAAAAAVAAAAASAAAVAPGALRRTSARARRGRGGGQATLRVSATDTLRKVKLLILERFQVHPNDQVLYLAGKPLGEDDVTLGAAGVTPGAKLFCAAGTEHDPDDVAGLLDAADERDAPELGFSGTGLLGAAAPPLADNTVHEVL
jgi:hypothetical protein